MRSQRLGEVLGEHFPFQESVIEGGILYAGTKAILYGQYKAMKSMLVTRLGLNVASGEPWIGLKTPADGMSVLYLQLEIPKRQMQKRLKTMAGRTVLKKDFYIWTEHFIKLDTDSGMAALEMEVEETKPGLLIIDPIYKVMSGDMLSANAIQPLLDNIDKLMGKYPGMSVVLVSHTRKGKYDDWGSDDLIGSVIFSAWADTVIKILRGEGKNTRIVKFEVTRHTEGDMGDIHVAIDPELQMLPIGETVTV